MTILSVFFLELLLKTDIICQKSWYSNEPHAEKTNFFWTDFMTDNCYQSILSYFICDNNEATLRVQNVQKFTIFLFWNFQIILSIRVNNWILRIIVLMVHGSTKHYNNNNLSFLPSFTLSPLSLSTALTYSFSLNCSFFVFLYVNISI